MDINGDKSLFIGIDKGGDLVKTDLNFNDLNKGTKWYNPHYSIRFEGFTEIIDSEKGEEDARERLSDSEYWEDIGFLSSDMPGVLKNNIDFKGMAEDVISSDGWEMTNGEFYLLGDFEDKEYYINLNWCGFGDKHRTKEEYKKLFISEDDFNYLMSIKEIKEDDKKGVLKIKTIFSKYQNTKEIIKAFLEEKDLLN